MNFDLKMNKRFHNKQLWITDKITDSQLSFN